MGRFLKWGDVNVRGIIKGILVFYDNKVLESGGMEVGEFTISCHLKNVRMAWATFLQEYTSLF